MTNLNGMMLLERALEVAPDRVMATLLPAFVDDLTDSDVDAILALFPREVDA